jgi:26S proteasome regulatory subunit N7
MADDIVLPIPNLSVAQNIFILSNPSLNRLHDEARANAIKGIEKDRSCSCIVAGCVY